MAVNSYIIVGQHEIMSHHVPLYTPVMLITYPRKSLGFCLVPHFRKPHWLNQAIQFDKRPFGSGRTYCLQRIQRSSWQSWCFHDGNMGKPLKNMTGNPVFYEIVAYEPISMWCLYLLFFNINGPWITEPSSKQIELWKFMAFRCKWSRQ